VYNSRSMPKPPKKQDPFAEREAENYANPIPSREFILKLLEQLGKPIRHEALLQELKLEGADQAEALRRRMIAMSRDGQIISNRRGAYGLATHMDLLKGRVQGNKDGFGFFIPEDGSDDLFLGAREMEKLFDGDQVLARLSGLDRRGRREGTIVEILQRRYTQIVGRYYREQGFGIVVPDSKRISHEILIPENQSGNAEDGQFVVAELTEYPGRRRKALGKITEVLGDITTPGLEIDVAIQSHDIPYQWPSSVKKETNRFAGEVTAKEFTGRKDLREVPFVTIDGEDAKDFDDAVYARRKKSGGWTLFVAIADVSHYVAVGSALDEEATNRGTSVYFPGHVIPMLPEKLSNGLCSLKPKVDRLTLVCEMELSPKAELINYCFFEAVIHSHCRMTYTEVADIIQPAENPTQENSRNRMRKRHESLCPHLDDLYSLYHALREARNINGALDFDTTETRIVFGENKKIREIVPVFRNDAHRLIEECMLCANVAAAKLLEASEIPALYRIHEGPNPAKLDNLREFLSEMGLYLAGGEKPSPSDYAQVISSISGRADQHLLQTMLIRSLMQAVYQPENLGHFGLGYPAYAHFTSPIRRYPDLLVHRAIRYLIRNKPGKHVKPQAGAFSLSKKDIYPYTLADMVSLGESCSMAERRADAAGYSVMDWLKCEYMQEKIGDEFSGTVSSVTSFGLFVELSDIYIEGLVHISELSNDYYHFDPVRHCLTGERSNKTYRLGDSVEVKLVRVDLDDKKIDLQMLGVNPSARSDKPAGKRKNKSRSHSKDNTKKADHKKPGKKGKKGKKAKGGKPGKPANKESHGNKPSHEKKNAAGSGKPGKTSRKPKKKSKNNRSPKNSPPRG